MDTKIWTYTRTSDGAEFTLTTDQAVRAAHLAMRGSDPFEALPAPARRIELRSELNVELPLAA